MLADMLKTSMTSIAIPAASHAALSAVQPAVMASVVAKAKEQCHVCGFRIPGMMEVDHLRGHRKSKSSDLACICQFCHSLKHPLWAGANGRIIPIIAPDMTQEDLHRLAWVCLAWRDVDADHDLDVDGIVDAMEARHTQLLDTLGAADAESLFEAVFDMRRLVGDDEAKRIAMRLDQFVRFWPAELTAGFSDLPRASRVSAWGARGFRVLAEDAAEAIRKDTAPDMNKIRRAAEMVLAEKAAEDAQ